MARMFEIMERERVGEKARSYGGASSSMAAFTESKH